MERYKRLFETFVTMVQYNGEIYDIYCNPSSRELSKIPSVREIKEVRGILDFRSNSVYIFDSRLLHAPAHENLKCVDYVNIFVDMKYKEIRIHSDQFEGVLNNKFIKIYFKGYTAFSFGDDVGVIE